MNGISRLALVLPLVLSAAGCSSENDSSSSQTKPSCDEGAIAPASAPALELLRGGPGADLVPLVDDDQLAVEFGSQGGQHVTLHARLFSDDPLVWKIIAELRQPMSSAVLATGSVGFTSCASQWTHPRPLRVVLETYDLPVSGTLHVQAAPASGAPITIDVPVTVGGN